MRQLVIGIVQGRIGYGNHIDMICDRIDNQQQIGIGTRLLIRRTGTVQTAQVNGKGLLGNVLLFLGLNGIGFGIGFQNLYIFLKILDVCFRHIVEGFRDCHCGYISLLHLIIECRIIHFLFGSIGADVLGYRGLGKGKVICITSVLKSDNLIRKLCLTPDTAGF